MFKMENNNFKIFVYSEKKIENKQGLKNFIKNIYGDKNVEKVYVDYEKLTGILKKFASESRVNAIVLKKYQECGNLNKNEVIEYYKDTEDLDLQEAFAKISAIIYFESKNCILTEKANQITYKIGHYPNVDTYIEGTAASKLANELIKTLDKVDKAVEI